MSSLPRNPDPKPGETSVIIYGYVPRLSLAVACCVLFGLYFVVHLVYAFLPVTTRGAGTRQTRDTVQKQVESPTSDKELFSSGTSRQSSKRDIGSVRTFQLLLSIGSLIEVVGYGFRARSHANPYLLTPFILQYFLIVVAPILFSAALYLALATIVRSAPTYATLCPIGPRLLIWLFVVADVLTIITQVAGAALFGVAQSRLGEGKVPPVSAQAANDILTAGLAVQTAFFTVFLVILAIFLARLGRLSRQARPDPLVMATLTVSSVLVLLRTTFRLAESADGIASKSATNEDLFAALEAAPVLAAVALWVAVPLGCRLNRSQRFLPTRL